MYCPFCGKEIPEYSTFCISCGKQIQNQRRSLREIISWEAILIGAVGVFIGFVIMLVLLLLSFGMDPDKWSSTATYVLFLGVAIILFIPSVLTGYMGEKRYLSGVINGFVVVFLFFLVAGILAMDVYVFASVIIFGILGILGGLTGVFIKKRVKAYDKEQYHVQ